MKLVVFLTYGVSLNDWHNQLIINRELALYKKYTEEGHEVAIVDYGRPNKYLLTHLVDGITVLPNRWYLPNWLYGLLVPLLHKKTLFVADVYKTNQMSGAHVARLCAKKFNKCLVIRQGYGYYDFTSKSNHSVVRLYKSKFASRYERKNIKSADCVVVTSERLRQDLASRMKLEVSKSYVIPNYVVGQIWSPSYKIRKPRIRLVIGYVGRLVQQKNLLSLIKALECLPVELKLIGDGPQGPLLKKEADALGLKAEFLGQKGSRQVVSILRTCDVFILPSFYEGHPKTLIEAMYFGMPILAANSPGINEFVKNGHTGILVEPTIDGLRQGVGQLAAMSREEKNRLSKNARLHAIQTYSLDRIYNMESKLLQSNII